MLLISIFLSLCFEFWLPGPSLPCTASLRSQRSALKLGAQSLQRGGSSLGCSVSVFVGRELRCSVACGTLAIRPEIEPGSPTLEGRLLFVFFLTLPKSVFIKVDKSLACCPECNELDSPISNQAAGEGRFFTTGPPATSLSPFF